jgi:hypothetical protein
VTNPDRAVFSLTEKAVKHKRAFETDRFGRSPGAEISFEELIDRLGLVKKSSVT